MKRYTLIAAIAALALFVACWPAHADPVLTPYIGANAISFSNSIPSDFELGGGGSISMSPHVSAVGSAWYGVGHTYLRGTIGARFTISDANNPDFSIGLGAQYNASSKPAIRAEGWDADATVGWRPYPQTMPRMTLVAQGAYYLAEPNPTYLMLGVRYILNPL